MHSCPLCFCESQRFCQDDTREYQQCRNCKLVFVPEAFHLTAEEEKAQYDLHENSPDDNAYRAFLSRLYLPMLELLPKNSLGLDFGSGPGPTLSIMFEEAGHRMALFDIFYAQDKTVLTRCYDFITATEVVEHLARPADIFTRLWGILKPGGWLGIMTKRVQNRAAFAHWHYKNDPTHIAFYSNATFCWLADELGAELYLMAPDVVLMRKAA
ncbi:MAG: class I SAM-dependent methyltransferase [Pseudomonadales bacterium]|nr:class I SAM-dependent methyltransferase [Pseudomonadales bacterium]